MSNFEDTRHQQETARLLLSGPDRFLQKLGDDIEDKLRNSLPDGVSIDGLTFPQELAKYVRPGQIVGIGMFRQNAFFPVPHREGTRTRICKTVGKRRRK